MTIRRHLHLNNLFIKSRIKIPLKLSINQNKVKLTDKNKKLQIMNSLLQKLKKFKMEMKMMIIWIMINKMTTMIQVMELMNMTTKIQMKKMKRN